MLRLFGPNCTPAPIDCSSRTSLPRKARWIDLLEPDDKERQLVEEAIGQPLPSREELLEIEPSSRLYERDGILFMTAAVLYGFEGKRPDTDPIGFILARKLLVTIRYIDPDPFTLVAEDLYSGDEEDDDNYAILVKLLDAIIGRLADELEDTGREVERVSERIFEHRGKRRSAGRRVELRLEALLVRLGAVQRMLAEIRHSALSTERLLGFLRAADVTDKTGRSERIESFQGDVRGLLDHAYFLSDNLTFLLDASLGLISLEQNNVMKLFSVIAVVLMPPTLVAGIYGMNFRFMPELGWPYGYPLALGVILVSAVVPYLVARRSGWL